VVAGCAHPPLAGAGPTAPPPGIRYAFTVRDEIRSEVLDAAGRPVAVPGLGTEALAWEGELDLGFGRSFPDDSVGWLVRLGTVRASVDGVPVQASADPSGLSLELRAFPSREILAVDLLDHLVGAPRHGDLLLPLLLALSPAVPEVPVGSRASRRVNLPILPEPGRGVRTAWDLAWIRLEDAPREDGRCIAFRWTGPMEGRGGDGGDGWAARYEVAGTASGETCLGREDFHPVSGFLDWDATITTTFGVATGAGSYQARGVLRQHHAWSGRVSRTGGVP